MKEFVKFSAIGFNQNQSMFRVKEPQVYHVCSINWGRHLDLPEVLAFGHLLGATDCCCTTAVFRVKAHFAIVTAQ